MSSILTANKLTQILTLVFNEITGCSPKEFMGLLFKDVLHARKKTENTYTCEWSAELDMWVVRKTPKEIFGLPEGDGILSLHKIAFVIKYHCNFNRILFPITDFLEKFTFLNIPLFRYKIRIIMNCFHLEVFLNDDKNHHRTAFSGIRILLLHVKYIALNCQHSLLQ